MSGISTSVFRVFLPFALGYFLSYLFRVVNAVIAPDLAADLMIDPAQLGLLTSAYFIAFASSQLPLGILLDRFGPKIVEACLLIFAGIGALVFAKAHTLTGLIIGRALIGFGVSACLMAAFKSYVLWFRQDLWPRINGFQMAAGGLGALSATTPVELFLNISDWRGLFMILSAASFTAALIIFAVVPEKKAESRGASLPEQIAGIKQVFSSIRFWEIAPLAFLSQAGLNAVQGLWAGPWLRDVAELSRPETAKVLFCMALAMIAGYILLGILSERLSRIGFSVRNSAVLFLAVFIVVQALITFNAPVSPYLLWILFGFFGTSGILTYSALSYSFPMELSGRVTTGLNLLVFIGAFSFQWAIGAIINLWEVSDIGQYHPSGYQAGFLLLLVLQVLSLVWTLFSFVKHKKMMDTHA